MKLHSDTGASGNRISAYGPGHFVINDTRFSTCLVVTAESIESEWPLHQIEDLSAEGVARLRALEVEILLIGTGDTHVFLSTDIMSQLSVPPTGVEVMTTQAACRTFNILAAESRSVAALLIPLKDSPPSRSEGN